MTGFKPTYKTHLSRCRGMLLIAVFMLVPAFSALFAQGVVLDNTGGKINNQGTIRIKSGQVKNLNDTIDGRVEFSSTVAGWTQNVPNIIYNQLVIRGLGKKIVESYKLKPGDKIPLVVRDSLLIIEETRFFNDSEEVVARGTVMNTALMWGTYDLRLQGDSAQNVLGSGKYEMFNLDNSKGADVIGGDFRINKKLELTKGDLRNGIANNFTLSDSILIVRHVGASLSHEPQFEGYASVQYTGGGSLVTGPEIPTDSTKLLDLTVTNTEGVVMSRSFTVNRNLFVGSSIYTEPDDTTLYVLTLTAPIDPVFGSDDAEVVGSLRRKNLLLDSSVMIFNNPYTYSIFSNPASAGGLTELTFRVRPLTYPPFAGGDRKVQRYISVSGRDKDYNPVQLGVNMTLGYGWRSTANTARDETHNLAITKLILQRWAGSKWFDIKSSRIPQVNVERGWAFSYATNVSALGSFAIGMPGGANMFLNAKVFLEGPYRFGSMALDLNHKNLIPKSPPDIYPYNMDPNRNNITVASIPDSVVDWIVLEFRNSLVPGSPTFVTCFVRTDGNIVDIDGQSRILLSSGGIDTGEYFIVIRHRNHLSVITEDPVKIYPETENNVIDFTKPELVLGRTNSLRPLAMENNTVLFGMIAGDVNADGVIDEDDRFITWENRDLEGYLVPDINMSGIINTRDLNYIWNNRMKTTAVP